MGDLFRTDEGPSFFCANGHEAWRTCRNTHRFRSSPARAIKRGRSPPRSARTLTNKAEVHHGLKPILPLAHIARDARRDPQTVLTTTACVDAAARRTNTTPAVTGHGAGSASCGRTKGKCSGHRNTKIHVPIAGPRYRDPFLTANVPVWTLRAGAAGLPTHSLETDSRGARIAGSTVLSGPIRTWTSPKLTGPRANIQ
jgi:hypothetical protein